MRRSVCFLLWLAFLGSAAETLAGELASPKGFAITYPDGWTPASQTQLNDVGKGANAAPPLAMICGPQFEMFGDSLNVHVVPSVIAVDATGKKVLTDALKQRLAAIGAKLTDFKSGRRKVAGTTAISVAFENAMPGIAEPLLQWQLFIPGKSQTYIVTCTARKSHWAEAWPGFKAMIKNFRVDVKP